MTDEVALKEYVEKLLASQRLELLTAIAALHSQFVEEQTNRDKAGAVAVATVERAIGKAEAATEKRFDSVNEWRRTVADLTSGYLPRVEYNARQDALDSRLAALERFRAEVSGRESTISTAGTMLYSIIIAAAALIGIVLTLFFKR